VSVAPPPGPHGGDSARLAEAMGAPVEAVLDLSVSLNPCAPDASPVVARHAGAIRHYPDPAAATEALAGAMGVDAARVVLTNGGAEAITAVAAARPVGWVEEPEFSLYARHLTALRRGAPRWRSNPHNPTGRLAAGTERADVWDEAFFPLAAGRWTRGDEGAVVVGSLTKVLACPGLRAGYVLAPDDLFAGRVRAWLPEWSVNGLVCAALPELLTAVDLPAWRDEIAALRARLVDVLERAGLVPESSDACFVLVPKAPGLRDHLARELVLVRDTGSFGIADGVRIAVPDDAGMDRLERAMEGWSP